MPYETTSHAAATAVAERPAPTLHDLLLGHAPQEILESLHEGLAVVSLEERLGYLNQNAGFMLQLRDAAYHGLPLHQAFPPEIARELSKALHRVRQGGAIHTAEIASHFPGGTLITLGVCVSPLPECHGGTPGFVITFRDQSVSRELTRLEDIARAKEEFFSTISHELRTPLTSIIAYADVLLEGAAAMPGETREFLEVIHSESARLGRLIDEVLELSRMEANRLTLRIAEFDFRDVLRASTLGISGPATRAGVRVEAEIGPEPVLVRADPARLHQVFANLLSNAVKFTRPGGRVTAGYGLHERTLEGWVRDTGVGVAPEDVARMFEKFERLEEADSPVKGTGLGLTITKGLVERMGGRIWVESKAGAGTTIHFTLPRANGPDPAEAG